MQAVADIDEVRPVIRVTSRYFPSNAYVVGFGQADACVLIDPGLDPDQIDEVLAQRRLRPEAILCTHGHFDHLGSAATFQSRFGIPVYLHEADLQTARSSNFLLMAMKMEQRIKLPVIDCPVNDGFTLAFDDVRVQFIAVPGHTPGSCVIMIGGLAFTGDTLYSRGVGLSGLPGEDTKQLKTSINLLLQRLDDGVLVMPGHGEHSTLAGIKEFNFALKRFLEARIPIPDGD
jgi:glyoxylase-like metal-dependent hydrolase (beta-lactamase superfamily II)